MAFDKTIQICIFDGNPYGCIMCELSNWNGRIYKVSRNELIEFSKRNDAENTGVYFLMGKNADNVDIVYVGEAEQMLSRLKQHLSDKDKKNLLPYWNDCIAVISKDNLLNKAHVKYLEHQFYTLAKDAGRAELINRNVPTRSSVSEYDEAMLQEFISNTQLLLNTLGYKTFESLENSSMKHQNEQLYFYIKAPRGADAKGVIVADGFAVLKDSVVASTVVPSMPASIARLRDDLVSKGIINTKFKFTKDYIFTSPSLAASIVMGRNANGRTEWKTETDKSIKMIEEENLN